MLDVSQRAVAELSETAGHMSVLGAPGSGRTTTLIELVATRVAAGAATDEVLVLAANRRSADALKQRIHARLGGAVRGTTLGRTPVSVALEIVGDERARYGGPRPVLMTGAAQDDDLAQFIAGLSDEQVARFAEPIPWPAWFNAETLGQAAFRGELRDLMAALTERELGPAELAELAASPAVSPRLRELWPAVAELLRRYETLVDDRTAGDGSVEALTAAHALVLARRLLAARPASFEPTAAFARLRLLAVDDAQELTESARALVAEFARRGVQVVTFGDPDIATGRFHGGRAEFAVNWRDVGEPAPATHTLSTVYRHGSELRAVVQRAANGLPTAASPVERRTSPASEAAVNANARAGIDASAVPVAAHAITASHEAETALITGFVRRLNLIEGIPLSDIGVVARSTGRLASLARGFDRAGIATRESAAVSPSTDRTVRALIDMAQAVVIGAVTRDALMRILASPLYRVDMLSQRRLRRALAVAAQQRWNDEHAKSEQEALGTMELPGENDPASRQQRAGWSVLERFLTGALTGVPDAEAAELVAGLQRVPTGTLGAVNALAGALARMGESHRAGGTVSEVLYEAWADEAREARWRKLATGIDDEAIAMNRRLDAVVAFYDRAERLVEQQPALDLESFVELWQQSSVADDSIAPRAELDAVTLTTPAGAVGQQWRAVVLAGVNDGEWPNLRLRNSFLGADRLDDADRAADEPASVLDLRAEVLADEQRMLVAAVSRAREHLLVTAVDDTETTPSGFVARLELPELSPSFAVAQASELRHDQLDVNALVGSLRRAAAAAVAQGRANDAQVPLAALARLAAGGVDAAAPATWYGLRGRSSDAVLTTPIDERGNPLITVRPSSLQHYVECPAKWFVDEHEGQPSNRSQHIGILLHLVAENADTSEFETVAALQQFADDELNKLEFASKWERDALRPVIARATASIWQFTHRQGVVRKAAERPLKLVLRSNDVAATVQVFGRIDRIEIDPEKGWRIVDFKNGKDADSKAAAADHEQLTAYQLALLTAGLDDLDAGRPRILGEPDTYQFVNLEGDNPYGGACLVYPRIESGKPKEKLPYKVVEQRPLTRESAAEKIAHYLEIGVQQIAPTHQVPLFEHCLDPETNGSCRIHAIPEVTA